MRLYTQITIEQRYQIYGLKKAGFNQSRIALDLNIHKSTISREISRNDKGVGGPVKHRVWPQSDVRGVLVPVSSKMKIGR